MIQLPTFRFLHSRGVRSCSFFVNQPEPQSVGRCIRLNVANRSAISSSLISVLKDELKYERENYRKDEQLLEPPNDFEIDNPAGKNAFYLLKEYKSENIVIEVDLDNQPDAEEADDFGEEDDDEDDEAEETQAVRFRVSISKGSTGLIFECESDGENLAINHIAHDPGSTEEEEDDRAGEPAYTGPVFEELDDTLQQAFLDYLEERGITTELGNYLKLMCNDKMAQEYQAWLGRVKDFVAM